LQGAEDLVMRRHRTLLIVVGVVVVLLIAARVALPGVMERTINRQIASIDNVQGGVRDVSLSMLRGHYELEGLELWHRPDGKEALHFAANRIAMNVSWSDLLRGQMVGDALIDAPRIDVTLVDEKVVPPEAQFDLAQTLQQLFPFRIDGAVVRNGTMTVRTARVQPAHALKVDGLNVRVSNITNAKRAPESAFATFAAAGKVQESATLMMHGNLNPTAAVPTFEMDMSLRQLPLTKLNPWLEQYVKAKAETGTFQTHAKLSAAEGKFKGFISPKTDGLEMTSVEERNLLQQLWAGLVEWVGETVANDDEPTAERVAFNGTIQNPDAGILPAMMSTTRSAFVASFIRSVGEP
jgi:hypothetical protein